MVAGARKAAKREEADQYLCRGGVCMSRKLFSLTVLLVFLGTSGASAQTIYGSAFSGNFGGGVPGPSFLYAISPTTGAATLIGPIGFPGVGSLAIAPNGVLYGIADLASGAGT